MNMFARTRDWFLRDSRWIPACFFAFFGIVFAVNALMVTISVATWNGLVNDEPYDRGIRYNAKLEAARAQDALGWRTELDFARDGETGHGRLSLGVSDRDGNGIERARAYARFHRPTHEGHDFLVQLVPQPGGGYGAPVALPLPGLWEVRVQIDHGETSYRFTDRVFVR